MNDEIKYLINSLYRTCFEDKKNHIFFEKDDLELHLKLKNDLENSYPINNDKIVDEILKIFENKELINNITELYIKSVQHNKKILKLDING